MINYTIPKDIEKDAKDYMQNVLEQLDSAGMLENVDSAALTMLARNYSMFIYNINISTKEICYYQS